MARTKKGVTAPARHKKILKQAKGFSGTKKNVFRAANTGVMRALREAYKGRKHRKRDFRKLWITRINAAARLNGLSYSKLINGLKKTGVEVNRKMLSELAINNKEAFTALCDKAKMAK